MKKIIAAILTLVMLACYTAFSCAEESPVLAGGWQVTEDPAVTAEAGAALDKALEGLVGVGYQPVALLATQVVAGTNYCILCKGTTVTAVPQPFYALVYVSEDLQHNASVMDIQRIDYNPEYPGLPEDDWQNPVMNIVGYYEDETSGRAVMSIEAGEGNTAHIGISWGNSATETVYWEITGEFDADAGIITYRDGSEMIISFDENDTETVTTVYNDGEGTFRVMEDGSVTWQDGKEDAGRDCRFVWINTGTVDEAD